MVSHFQLPPSNESLASDEPAPSKIIRSSPTITIDILLLKPPTTILLRVTISFPSSTFGCAGCSGNLPKGQYRVTKDWNSPGFDVETVPAKNGVQVDVNKQLKDFWYRRWHDSGKSEKKLFRLTFPTLVKATCSRSRANSRCILRIGLVLAT